MGPWGAIGDLLKTFSEAMGSVILDGDEGDSSSVVRSMADQCERFKGVAEEAGENEDVNRLLYAHIAYCMGGSITGFQTLFSVFMAGVIVGMTMERQELE